MPAINMVVKLDVFVMPASGEALFYSPQLPNSGKSPYFSLLVSLPSHNSSTLYFSIAQFPSLYVTISLGLTLSLSV